MMWRTRNRFRQVVCLAWMVGLMIVLLMLGSIGSVQAAEDPFASMAVQRPVQVSATPDLALPTLEGMTVNIKDFRGKVVLLGFFTTA